RPRAGRKPVRGGARGSRGFVPGAGPCARARGTLTGAIMTREQTGARGLVRAVPAWAWLAGIVVLSAGLRFLLARRIVAPWIMVDELIYSELAKSFAAHGHFAIRGASAGGSYGLVYPALLSPAYRLFDSVPDAYQAAKAINSVLMSLAAIPA